MRSSSLSERREMWWITSKASSISLLIAAAFLIAVASFITAVPPRFGYTSHRRCKQEAGMISANEQAVDDGDGIPAPSPQDQDVILDAWREVLAQVLHARDSEWKEQLRAIRAESMAAVAELRAAAAEFRSTMERMIAERLAQIRQPVDGKEGPQGEPGPRGEAGPPGRIEGVRAYVEDTVHYEGDIVVREGSTYQAKRDTTRAPPHADWACIAAAGRDARMKVCGTHREGETYKYLDVVALNGGSFIARADDPGPCPGDGWQLIASAGRAGKPGANGERGEQGERGLPGQAGPTILAWQIDPERYCATALLSDGSEGPALELRPLFERYHMEISSH
jgi:hypothetical protein